MATKYQETIDTCNATLNSMVKSMSEHKEVSRELFNKLAKGERFAVVDTSKFRAVFKKNDLCSCCFSDAKTTKCIHQDCTGACAKCRGDNEDADCCACGKKQVMECPICQDFMDSPLRFTEENVQNSKISEKSILSFARWNICEINPAKTQD